VGSAELVDATDLFLAFAIVFWEYRGTAVLLSKKKN